MSGAGRTRSCDVAAATVHGRERIGGVKCPVPGSLRKQLLSCSVHSRRFASSPASDPLAIGEKAGNRGWDLRSRTAGVSMTRSLACSLCTTWAGRHAHAVYSNYAGAWSPAEGQTESE